MTKKRFLGIIPAEVVSYHKALHKKLEIIRKDPKLYFRSRFKQKEETETEAVARKYREQIKPSLYGLRGIRRLVFESQVPTGRKITIPAASRQRESPNKDAATSKAVDLETISQRTLGFFKKEYDKTSNPLCAWFAFSYCRDIGENIPEWISEYLDRVASGLHASLDEDGRADKKVFGNLEMNLGKGPGDVFSRFSKNHMKNRIITDIKLCKKYSAFKNLNINNEDILRLVAEEYAKSYESVREYYYSKEDY